MRKMATAGRKASVYTGMALSIVVIGFILRGTDIQLIRHSFEKLNAAWIFPMVFVYISGFLVRGIRWHVMLLPVKFISVKSTTEGIVVGYAANNILPARAGEIVRALFIGQTESISRATALGTVLVERVFDGAVIVGILILCTLKFSAAGVLRVGDGILRPVMMMGSLIFGIAILLIWLGFRYLPRLECMLGANKEKGSSSRMAGAKGAAWNVMKSIYFLRGNRRLGIVILCSVGVWAVEGMVFWLGLVAFQLPADIFVAYFTLALANLGMLLPSAPGGVGVFQAGSMAAFSLIGMTPESALSYSIVVHAVMIVPITLTGFYLLRRYSLKWSASENPYVRNDVSVY